MPSRFPNSPDAIRALPDIRRTGYSRAILLNLDTNERWQFLLNPSQLNYTTSANYFVGSVMGTNQQPMAWTSSNGLTLQINDLILDTTDERKSCRAAIERLVTLSKATPNKGRPPQLSFVWGEQSLSPCVIVGDIEWTETGHVNGVAVRASLSFTLQEAGEPKPLIIRPTIELIPSTTQSGGIPIPAPSQNPPPAPVPQPGPPPAPQPGQPPTTPPPTNPNPPQAGVPTDEAALDRLGFAAGISLDGASAFAISATRVLTAAHMVRSVGQSVRLVLRGNDSTVEKTVTGTVRGINQSLDAAWIECPPNSFSVWWILGDESKLKNGDRAVAYGHPSGGSPNQEKTTGVVRELGRNERGVNFGMTDSRTRLLYPGNSGGAIACGQIGSSEYGKIISLTSGGQGRPSIGQTIQNWQSDRVWGPRITQVKSAFNL